MSEPPQIGDWTLVPELRIGSEDSAEYALTDVRRIAVGPTDGVFVLQPADGNVRVFDSSGHFVRFIGRPGEGPGEFGSLVGIGFHADTLWVSDRSRVSYFSVDGRFIRSEITRYDPGGANLSPGGVDQVLADGSFAVVPNFVPTVDRSTWPEALPVHRINQGRIQVVLGAFDLSVIRTYVGPDDRPRVAFLPLHPLAVYAYSLDGRSVVLVEQAAAQTAGLARFRIVRIGLAGDTVVDREVEYVPVPVPEHVRDSIATGSNVLPGREVPHALAAARLRAAPVPAHYPPVETAVVADDGSVWLGLQGHSPPQWLVLDSAAAPVARVTGEPTLRILVIRGGEAWGVIRDELDVPSLVRYRVLHEGVSAVRRSGRP